VGRGRDQVLHGWRYGEFPTICGTGTEDYFGGAWDLAAKPTPRAFLGYPLYRKEPTEVPQHGLYRWHIMDPIRFQSDLRVTMQALGLVAESKFEPLTDDISSVAYWYQSEPHAPFPRLARPGRTLATLSDRGEFSEATHEKERGSMPRSFYRIFPLGGR
jgi:hypothetical protein